MAPTMATGRESSTVTLKLYRVSFTPKTVSLGRTQLLCTSSDGSKPYMILKGLDARISGSIGFDMLRAPGEKLWREDYKEDRYHSEDTYFRPPQLLTKYSGGSKPI